jgi:hypothetical protein
MFPLQVWWRKCAFSIRAPMLRGLRPSFPGGTGKPCSGVGGGESPLGMPAGGLPAPDWRAGSGVRGVNLILKARQASLRALSGVSESLTYFGHRYC